jgi:hypothetical protein
MVDAAFWTFDSRAVTVAFYAVGAYALAGVLLLVPFHRWAVPRLDESAQGASRGFLLLVSPGLVALWPVILRKWMVARRGGEIHGSPDGPVSSLNIRRTQSVLMKLIAIAVPLLVAAAILARPAPPPRIDANELKAVAPAPED